jgi:hypothetical protein
MGFIIPFVDTDLGFRTKVRQDAIRMLGDLVRARGKRPEDFVVRDILPKTDLGLANEEWKITYASAYAWETKINVTLPENKFVVLFGYQNNAPSPKTLAVRLFRNVEPLDVIEVEQLYTYAENPIGFFAVLGWMESDKLQVDFYGNAAGDDYPVLRGLVAEPAKATITRPLLSDLLREIGR